MNNLIYFRFALLSTSPLVLAAFEDAIDIDAAAAESESSSSDGAQTTIIIVVIIATTLLLAFGASLIFYFCSRSAPQIDGTTVRKRRVHFPKTSSKLAQVTYLSEKSQSQSQSASNSNSVDAIKAKPKLSLLSKISSSSNAATVWKGHFKGKIVAVKRLNTTTKPGDETLQLAEKFMVEAQQMMEMHHERLVGKTFPTHA
jgi:hypothetical protein